MLLEGLFDEGKGARVVRVGDEALTFAEVRRAAVALAATLTRGSRIAVVAERRLETVVAVAAGLLAGAPVVPLDPGAAPGERAHQLDDARPVAVLRPADVDRFPDVDAPLDRPVRLTALADAGGELPAPPADDDPALIMYTSGTTGRPKGAVLPHRAVAANLDALAEAWAWRDDDLLTHALPLYHVHGLVLGVLGPLRRGTSLRHLGTFAVDATVDALRAGATVHFGVPTIYHRLADAADGDDRVADALRGARLLVSGSAGLPLAVHERVLARTGHTIVERYGMTETLITTAVPAGVDTKAGTVGPALPGVQLRVVDDDDHDVAADGEAMGRLLVRTPAQFTGYLNRPDATEAAMRDGWFLTGDVATIDGDGYLRIVGRDSTDIIKSGGYKIGAGEIEDVLLLHPAVREAAVIGVADDDLGQRIEAWLVTTGPGPADGPGVLDLDDVRAHAAAHLTPHKRPRGYHVVDELPRNALGKVQKTRLLPAAPA